MFHSDIPSPLRVCVTPNHCTQHNHMIWFFWILVCLCTKNTEQQRLERRTRHMKINLQIPALKEIRRYIRLYLADPASEIKHSPFCGIGNQNPFLQCGYTDLTIQGVVRPTHTQVMARLRQVHLHTRSSEATDQIGLDRFGLTFRVNGSAVIAYQLIECVTITDHRETLFAKHKGHKSETTSPLSPIVFLHGELLTFEEVHGLSDLISFQIDKPLKERDQQILREKGVSVAFHYRFKQITDDLEDTPKQKDPLLLKIGPATLIWFNNQNMELRPVTLKQFEGHAKVIRFPSRATTKAQQLFIDKGIITQDEVENPKYSEETPETSTS
jgi:hypothetical protein